MDLAYPDRMERELERLAAARRRLVHAGRSRPDDVRVAGGTVLGQYVAAADLERYRRLVVEQERVLARLVVVRPDWDAGLSDGDLRALLTPLDLAARVESAARTVAAHAANERRLQHHEAGAWERQRDRLVAEARALREGAAAVAAASAPRRAGEAARDDDGREAGAAATVSGPPSGSAPPAGAPAAAVRTLRVPVTEAQAAVVGFRFLDNDDTAGIVLDGATVAYPLERGAYIVETLEFYADQRRRNPDGLDGHRERRSTLALARKVRAANLAAASATSSSSPTTAEPDDQVADVAEAIDTPADSRGITAAPAPLPPALDGGATPAWDVGDTVLIADKWSPDGSPARALVMAEDHRRPNVVKVKYLASRTAAWVARARVLGPEPPQPAPAVEPGDQVADVVALPAGAEELVAATADYPPDRHPARTYLGRLAPSGRRSQAAGLGRIAAFLSGGRLDADELPWHLVRYQHVQRVRAWLADEAGLSPATANAYLAALRGVVTECWRLGYLGAEDRARALDFKRVAGDRLPRGRALSRGEMAAVFERLDGSDSVTARRDAAIIAVMYSGGGVRRTELVRFDLADLDQEACELRLRSGKGRKDRLVHLGAEACAALADWLDVRGLEPGALFLPVEKDRRTLRQGGRLDPTTVRLVCQRRAGQAGVATFSPHDLRRTSISDLLDLTGDLSLVSRLAGHASPSTTRRYDRRPVEAERRAARSLHVPYRSRRAAG